MNNRAMLGVRTRGHFGVNLQEERALFSMADLQAVTGQLYIAEGEIKEGAPGLLAQPAPSRPSRGRGQDFLFAHLTLTGSAAETAALSQQLLTLISQKYYSSVGSVTAALRDGLMAANQLLLRQNIGSSDPAREGAITLTVFRQGELFTLQAGESVALLGRNFGIERMPPQEPARVTPLGRSSGLDIRYYHHRLQTEDMLLLADPRLSHLPTDEFAPALVESDIAVGLEALTAVVGNDSARLLLVEFSADAPLELTEVRPVVSAAAAAMPDPQPRRQPPVMIADNPEAPTTQLTEPDGSAAVDREIVEHHARRAGSSAALGASRFTAWLADLLARLRPPRQEESEEEKVNWTWAVLIAIVIPLIVAAIVTSVYMAREQAQILSTTKIEMSQKLIVAEEAATPEEARQQYIEILALADQANTELKPGDSDVVQMQSIARTELDKLDGVTRLTADSFYEYSEETSLRRVALREGLNGGVFTLDVGNGAVYEHDTDDTYMNPVTPDPLQILFFGQAVGSRVVGNVVDFFWRPQGFAVQREGLAMLDSDGALITYQPGINSAFAVPLDLAVDWVNPVAVTGFDERIYILDTGAAVIWKYFPDGESFIAKADERTLNFSDELDLDLGNAVDFDLYSEDGSLVILYSDGRIRYYDTRSGRLVWDENTLLENGLTIPLQNPTAVEIVGKGLNATLFIADGGNGRVIQVSRPVGQVLAQYRATAEDGSELFIDITDFAVVELPLRLFVTKDHTLYSAIQE